MYASKLVLNSNGWASPTSLASDGVNINNGSFFGFEEWLNDPVFRELKIGYIDSFRTDRSNTNYDRVALFTYLKGKKIVYYVGNLYGVKQINYPELLNIRGLLQNRKWMEERKTELNTIFNETNAFELYNNCFNSNHITGGTQTTFVCNFKYEKLELFKTEKWVNLTKLDSSINNRWKRLKILYNVYKDDEYLFEL